MSSPNIKQNTLKIINYDQPERIEVCVPMRPVSYLGCDHESLDIVSQADKEASGTWEDIWGTAFRFYPGGISETPIGHPLTDGVDALPGYRWPDPNDERLTGKIYQDLKGITDPENGFITGLHRDLLWEKSYMLAGMENMMMWFIIEPELVKEIFHKIMDFQMGIAEHYLNAGVELVKFGDDLGGQTNALFSHEIFSEFILPEYRRIFDFYKQNNVLIYLHSCGNIHNFLEDYMDLGVDVLNPVQATANDLDWVRAKTQGRIALEGGVRSSIVMHGKETEVEQEVLTRMIQLGNAGGYFCKPDQTMPYPDNNYAKLVETVGLYGQYPLKIGTMNSIIDRIIT